MGGGQGTKFFFPTLSASYLEDSLSFTLEGYIEQGVVYSSFDSSYYLLTEVGIFFP